MSNDKPSFLISRPTGSLLEAWQAFAATLEKNRKLTEAKFKARKRMAVLGGQGMAIILAALLAFAPAAKAERLPNDCALIATVAIAQIAKSSAWSKVMFIKYIDMNDFKTKGHAVVVWQMFDGGQILLYDSTGSIPLKTHSRDLNDIMLDLNENLNGILITKAAFLE